MTATPRNRRKPPEPQLLNHELGILAFNRRVLAQAGDRRVPMLERLRFLCIVSSNLDEFFEIRVAELKERIKHGEKQAAETFASVSEQAHLLVAEQYRLLNDEVLPGLARYGVRFVSEKQWSNAQREWLHDYFVREMAPIITPIGLDPAHPFPRVLNKSLNFAVQLEGRDAFGRSSGTAVVQAPRVLPRIIRLPRNLVQDGAYELVLLSWILEPFLGALFQGLSVKGVYPFRVTRNSDLFVDEEEIKDLRTALAGELPQRHFGDSVRVEVGDSCPPETAEFLLRQFGLTPQDLYGVNGPVNLVRLMDVPEIANLPELKYASFIPSVPKILQRHSSIFRSIAGGDILLHHPYQSFNPVIEMLEQAAEDPDVVAIRQTVYRTGTDSVIMKYLIDAAQRGKEVTVVVELLARFDEEANIQYAAKLEEVGAHVIYGVVGYKTLAKMMLVTRRENGRLRRYAHLSTGNYHPRTAKFYTDFGLLTANEEICADVDAVFKQLTGLGRARSLAHLWVSPFTLHQRLIEAIKREIRHAKAGKPSHVIAKMNSLLEPKVIEALYAASQAGVKVDLIVRGVCALRPGIPGLSENIHVRSIIGRFLEHSRIFYFLNDGAQDVYLSSADWMERNFFRRIELCFPLLDARLKQRVIKEGLKVYLADNNQAWDMDSNGDYQRRRSRGRIPRSAQEQLLALLAPG